MSLRTLTFTAMAALLLLLSLRIELPLCAASPATTLPQTDADIAEFRLDDLKTRLQQMPDSPEHDYFAGVLANRTGHLGDSIRLLSRALPSIRQSDPARAAVALEALADDYNKTFHYADAARTDDDLLTHFSGQLGERLQGTKDDARVMHLLTKAPAQTITWQGPVRLKTEHNLIGSITAELDVNGVRENWLLDTGANFSVVSRGFARRLGLKPLPGFAQTTAGVTGIENPLQIAVLPTLQMPGVTLHNVILLVLDDANLNIDLGKQKYQINAIVGYPVFQALGVITFVHDGIFEAGVAARQDSTGTRMFMKQLTPVVLCGVQGEDLPFTLDTGASGTNLSVRYYQRFRAQAGSWKQSETRIGGAGGIVSRKIYMQPRLDLTVGDMTATLTNVAIFPEKMGTDIDQLYGNLGQDLVAQFHSFTLDFSRMTFSLGPPLATADRH